MGTVMILRIRKQDAAYLYQLLESYEGLANYSTLTLEKDLPYRDIKLHLAPDLVEELKKVVGRIQAEIPVELLG